MVSFGSRVLSITVVLLLALGLRLGFAFLWPGTLDNDAAAYHGWAKEMLQNGTFSTALRSPGYPAFVALIYSTLGIKPIYVYFVQALLSTVTVGLLYLIVQDILGREKWKIGVATAALVGLNPEIAAYSGLLLRESLSILLLVFSVLLWIRAMTRARIYAVPLGLVLAIQAYVRLEGCFFIPILVGLILIFSPSNRKPALTSTLIAGVIASIGILPWVVYCHINRGYTGMQVCMEPNLFARTWYLSPEGSVEPELRAHILRCVEQAKLTPEEVRRYTVPPLLVSKLPPGDIHAEVALYRRLVKIAQENMINHWSAYLQDSGRQLRKIFGGYNLFWWRYYWDAPPFPDNIRQKQWDVVALKTFFRGVWPIIVLLSGGVGIILEWYNKSTSAVLMKVLFIGTLLSIGLVCFVAPGIIRLRLPYDGFLYLAMVYGIWAFIVYVRSKREMGTNRVLV